MKKVISLFVVLALLLCTPICAGAQYETEMNILNELSIFRGDNGNYEKDRPATRMEACVMLTRLLGAEQKALASDGECVFTDVSDWAKPYAAYLGGEGIVRGTSDTTFSPDIIITAQMMATLLLRAVGIADFDYEDALRTAYDYGIADSMQNPQLTRAEMARMSYNALTTGGIISSLINEGVITEEDYANALIANDLDRNLQEFRAALGRYSVTMEGQLGISCTADGVTADTVVSHHISMAWDSNAEIKRLYSLTEVVKPINIGGTQEDFIQTVEEVLQGETLVTTVKSRGESYSYSRQYRQSFGTEGEFSSGRKTVSGDYTVYTFTLTDDYADRLSEDTVGTDITSAEGTATLYVKDGVAERYCLDLVLSDNRAEYGINADYLIIETDIY